MPGSSSAVGDTTRYAWLSIGAAIVTIGLKAVAFLITGSVGLLSDALESVVNLVASAVMLFVLRYAAAPPNRGHDYGYGKAEYFSSGLEGALIFTAAIAIVASAVPRLLAPRALESLGPAIAISAAAALVNLVVARVLLAAAKKHHSITLEADGHHLMTDVWTSAGVIVGIALVRITGVDVLDPLVAIAVAVNILWMGSRLLRRSAVGLLDGAVPPEERSAFEAILEGYAREEGIGWHALRTRQAGARRFVSVHVLVPGEWSVQRGHDLCERIEHELAGTRTRTTVFTHLEPLEDERSFADQGLDRPTMP